MGEKSFGNSSCPKDLTLGGRGSVRMEAGAVDANGKGLRSPPAGRRRVPRPDPLPRCPTARPPALYSVSSPDPFFS